MNGERQHPNYATVSVVVPHYNDLDKLSICLDALENQTLPRANFEVIVADNDSTIGFEGVVDVVRGRARVVLAPERGAGPARNVGVSRSSGAVLVFTDSDCKPRPQFLTVGLQNLTSFDIVGGAVEVTVEDENNLSGVEAFELVFAFRNDLYVSRKHFSVTANLFVPRLVFESVGPFRKGVAEDMDWCARARSMGFSIGYSSQAIVEHPARRNWSGLASKYKRLTNELYCMSKERRFGVIFWIFRSFLLLFSVIPHSAEILCSSKLNKLEDRCKAVGVLFGIRALRFAWAYRVLVRPV